LDFGLKKKVSHRAHRELRDKEHASADFTDSAELRPQRRNDMTNDFGFSIEQNPISEICVICGSFSSPSFPIPDPLTPIPFFPKWRTNVRCNQPRDDVRKKAD
jgi:hypothetical protein